MEEDNIEFKDYKPTTLVSHLLKIVNNRVFANNISQDSKNFSNNYEKMVKKVYEIDRIVNNL
ncbi:MAG: hypothetical protein Unbinned1643contig1000_35 [Prokaryotic dsDNA virus sp.]|nr:MAG: hypothetical protein Unbinned1643contig1000_35 [Prokaryotic dsDNA virus sp.]|tara:strand:- start:3055 stop:3240 length:186 start_codon:yes stop_codon:yes gene_type:complete